MPATRSPKKTQSITRTFWKIKQSEKLAKEKKSKRFQKQEESPGTLSHYISDASSDEDNEFEIAAPGGKLDESRYNNYHRSLRSRRGIAPPIHTKGQTIVNEILRIFDLSYEYGPCVGVTRLARWERAYKAGLNPPIQVKEILETQEGKKEMLAENVFHSEGI